MKHLLYGIYVLILLIPVVAWLQGVDLNRLTAYEFANLSGLVAFTLIFLQIAVGSFMNLLRPIVGNKAILNFHIWQGVAAFIAAHLHPAFFALSFGLGTILKLGGYVMWGRAALLLIVLSVAAGLLRTLPFMQRYWRWVHRINYLIFAMVYWHSWNLGMNVREFPMVILYWLSPIVVVLGIAYKLKPVFDKHLVKSKGLS